MAANQEEVFESKLFPGLAGTSLNGLRVAEGLFEGARQSRRTELKLCDHGLTSLPDSLGNLTQLQVLDLYFNQLTSLPDSLGNLAQLKVLDLSFNQLTSLPDSLGNLSRLQTLNVSHNQLTSLPDSLGNLAQLQILDLSRNRFTSLPDSLGNLAQLQVLKLSNNQLTSLPDSLGNLAQLQILDISRNRFTSLPTALKKLARLQSLNLDSNNLAWLSDALGDLTRLQSLVLDNNLLTSLPDALGNLAQLQQLFVFGNRLISLPEALGNLTQLQELYLNRNQLSSLPDILGNLTRLQTLILDNNQLTSLPDALGNLAQLQTLNLSGNQLTSLPDALHTLAKRGELRELYLHENTGLELPDEVLGLSRYQVLQEKVSPAKPLDILNYYFATRGGAARALRELKVILVGRGDAGKSSLVDALQGIPFDERKKKTEGIAITPWEMNLNDGVEGGKATAHLWDFGGQQIMHGTHQFFMTHRALYLVVLDGRDDRTKQEAEYWLKLVRAFGGNSPVMMVLNKQDAHPYDIDRGYVMEKYGIDVDGFFRTACKSGEGIAGLRNAIHEAAKKMLEAREKFPAAWWDMKLHLAQMRERKQDFLPLDEYCYLCAQKQVPQEDCGLLLRVLSELGTVVSFPDDVKLATLHVLNPEWATDGVYRVLNDRDLVDHKHGKLAVSELERILPADRWPKDKHQYLLDLMAKFQLCFPLNEQGHTVLVPELLPDQTPPLRDWKSQECLVFLYSYPALPHGVLPRFITRTHDLSEGGLRWRTGVTLYYEGARALVRADYDRNQVTIWVRGSLEIRRELLKSIRREFETIHRSIKDLGEKEWVAAPKHPEATELLSNVTKDYARGRATIPMTIRGEREDYPIEDLLNGVLTLEEREALHLLKGRGTTTYWQTDSLSPRAETWMTTEQATLSTETPALTGPELETARNALLAAHPKGPAQVLRLMDDDVNKYISTNVPLTQQWLEVLEAANAGGWTGALLQVALRKQPGNAALRKVAAQHGIPLPQVPQRVVHSDAVYESAESAQGKSPSTERSGSPRKEGVGGIDQTFTHCFNTIQQLSDDKAEVKAAMEELLKAVQALQPKLDAQAHAEATEAVETLTKEIARPEPRKKWLQLSGEGLMEAGRPVPPWQGPW